MAANEFMMDLSGYIPFQCSVCDQGFSNNYQLNMHILTHTGEKPFQCTHCDISFSEENDLKSHMLEHTGDCDPTTHMATHSEEKTNQCNF